MCKRNLSFVLRNKGLGSKSFSMDFLNHLRPMSHSYKDQQTDLLVTGVHKKVIRQTTLLSAEG